MTEPEITREYIQTGLREEIDAFTQQAIVQVTPDVKDFLPSGRIAPMKASDRFSIEMDDALAQIDADPANSGPAIERLAYLYFARMVAARVERGAVLGSRTEAMKQPVEPKPKATRKKAAKAEKVDEPTPPVTEPAPVTEVLESNADFLAQQAEPKKPAVPIIPAEAPTDDEPVELTTADNSVLDLL